MTKIIHVAAGVIHNAGGQILIAKRPDDTHQGGLWEFPGGKLEPDESVQAALVRELQEELGIHSTEMLPLIQIRHDYSDKSVLLDVWSVLAFEGEAHGKEGQPVKWVMPEELTNFQFPAANRPIVTAAQLPTQWLITGEEQSIEKCLAKLSKALESGVRLVQLRQKSWTTEQWQTALPLVSQLCRKAGARLLLNSPLINDIETLKTCADGIHLTSHHLNKESGSQLKVLQDTGLWLSASCHSREELQLAEALGVDFVTLSPVQPTASHPEQKAMGWKQFEIMVQAAKVPVFALGGMNAGLVSEAIARGGQGVAGINDWW